MANSRSAAKRHRQNIVRRVRNRTFRSTVRTMVKSFEVAVKEKNGEVAESCFKESVKLIDTASQKGLYHKNTAARKKNRLHKKLAESKSS